MQEEINKIFDDITVGGIVVTEGLDNVANLFEFLFEALEVAVKWIYEATNGEYDIDEIRSIISGNVKSQNIEEIVNKFQLLVDLKSNPEV